MAKSIFSQDVQPDLSTASVSPLTDSLDFFNTGQPRTYFDQFFNSGASNEGLSVDSTLFRNREIQLLRDRINRGIAGQSDISGYEYQGQTVKQIQDSAASNSSINSLVSKKNLEDIKGAELAARVDQYIEILKMGDTLDGESRQTLMEMYRSGARSVDIAKKLKDAKEGTGIYGERVLNKEQAKLSMERRVGDNRLGIL